MGGTAPVTENTVRYAPYLEDHHQFMMTTTWEWIWNALFPGGVYYNPYDERDDIEVSDAFFGAGYTIASFPSMYDMYGKFLAGLDVEILFDEIFNDTMEGDAITAMIAAESTRLEDELENETLPRFETGLRDMNAVLSSAFIFGRGLLEAEKTKALSAYSAKVKYELYPIINDRWKAHLEWNKGVIDTYINVMKTYYGVELEADKYNVENYVERTKWGLELMQYYRAAVGTLTGAVNETSKTKKGGGWLGALLQGAGMGLMFL